MQIKMLYWRGPIYLSLDRGELINDDRLSSRVKEGTRRKSGSSISGALIFDSGLEKIYDLSSDSSVDLDPMVCLMSSARLYWCRGE